MTIEDFSNGFDTLMNSYSRIPTEGTQDPLALDEYEKSLFLTQAQEDLALALYTGRNATGEGFEVTEETRRYLADLVREASLSPITSSNGSTLGIDSSSKFFTLPDDLWFITFEAAEVSNTCRHECSYINTIEVVPVAQDEYHKIRRNPFRGAGSRRALRLDLADNVVEIVSKKQVLRYYIRYIKKLSPIVLTDLPDGMSIEGVRTATNCKLHEGLHKKILQRAVVLAIQSKGVGSN